MLNKSCYQSWMFAFHEAWNVKMMTSQPTILYRSLVSTLILIYCLDIAYININILMAWGAKCHRYIMSSFNWKKCWVLIKIRTVLWRYYMLPCQLVISGKSEQWEVPSTLLNWLTLLRVGCVATARVRFSTEKTFLQQVISSMCLFWYTDIGVFVGVTFSSMFWYTDIGVFAGAVIY